MTLKMLREQLEGDLGLEKGALKPHKELISRLIDKAGGGRSAGGGGARPATLLCRWPCHARTDF